jgi:hypothetical protein
MAARWHHQRGTNIQHGYHPEPPADRTNSPIYNESHLDSATYPISKELSPDSAASLFSIEVPHGVGCEVSVLTEEIEGRSRRPEEFSFDNDAYAYVQNQRFAVEVPPGQLMIKLNRETFVVDIIYENSAIKDKVQLGDVLVEFDGTITTSISEKDFLALIKSSHMNPVRKLVFMRKCDF